MRVLVFITLLIFLSLNTLAQDNRDDYYAGSRLDYYTDEEVGEIMIFVPERLKESKIAVDLVFEYQPLNKGFLVASAGISTVPFPTKLMRVGQNEVTVSFYENDKWIDSRKVWVTIRPQRENAVKIEKLTGGLVTGNLLTMPVGFYTEQIDNHDFLANEAVNGFNLVTPIVNLEKKSLKDRKSFMNRCADLGMCVNYNVCNVAGGGSEGLTREKEISVKDKEELLRKEIEMFRDHPALLSWYIAEKPDDREFSPDSLKKIYQLIKELDPYHPVAIMIGSPRNAVKYGQCADILMIAPFPVPQGNVREVIEYTSITRNGFFHEKAVWIVPQAIGGNGWWTREPTANEVRAMTYLAVVNGAAGIQYYKRSAPNSFPKSVSTWNECASVAMEVAELTPDILSSYQATDIICDNPVIHARAYNRAGLVTIIVVNEKNEPGKFKITLKDIELTIKSEVLFENRGIVVSEGVIEDMIEGYGTRIYRFDARHKPDQVAGFQSGNLISDPGFENLSTPGIPGACYAYPGSDPGSTYFVDSRRHFQGEHSLRMNNPSEGRGNRLSFYTTGLDTTKSYSVSVAARAGVSPNIPGRKNGGAVRFQLSLGESGQDFSCTHTWETYQVSGIRIALQGDDVIPVSPQLELISKGTAWFDILQVYPDIELNEISGSAENLKIIELKCIHDGVKMFYTTDGSEPTVTSSPYQVPVELGKNQDFKVKAFKGDMEVGYIER